MQHADNAMKTAILTPFTGEFSSHVACTSKVLSGTTKVLLCILLCLILAACESGNTEDLRGYVQDIKARKKSNIPPLPDVKNYETYTYNETELRDPFTPTRSVRPTQVSTNNGIAPDLKREREVLEQFPLDTLKMVGILEQSGERWALIKAQDGTLYRTKKGRYIGQDNGRITRITETSVELTEIVPDGLGGWVKRQSTLSVTQ